MTRGRGVRIALTAVLIGVAIAFLLPQVWLFALSLKSKAGVFAYPPRLISRDESGANYAFVLTQTQLPWYLWNSVVIALTATIATGLLLAQMVSPIVLLVPLYGLISHLHLLDTHKGLVLVYAAVQLPFTIVVLRNFFDALPRSLFEAAILDGATRGTIFRRIALPLIGPGLASVAIFNLAFYWAEFGLALVLLDSQQRFTIPIGLFSFQSGYETEWQLVAAASFIGLLPVVAAFLALQRFFVAGLTSGATKG